MKNLSPMPFNFPAGRLINKKYLIQELLGAGTEGEVYRVIETNTNIERTAKFFYTNKNKKNRAAARYAKLLHKLSECEHVIHYHTSEVIRHHNEDITCLISEYVEGEILSEFLKKQPKARLGRTLAMSLLHEILRGLEYIHNKKIVHGDVHADNIIVQRYGLGFKLKILDMHYWGKIQRVSSHDDIYNAISIFYHALGGKAAYASHPDEIKSICKGLQRQLIRKKFKSTTALRLYLENIEWSRAYKEQ